ncbi:hypothetical protein SAMN03097708_03225 [Thiohalomonas denitrificans]|uniref:Uncharacterized protein n=1 Tax=Thiohalomonas denitrificans TaxID=415747 RepID=A0A1G5R1C5_9GAMM|nr:hypothetical protein SAMN03097708_03225 [Thiohalomonas denitrificans]
MTEDNKKAKTLGKVVKIDEQRIQGHFGLHVPEAVCRLVSCPTSACTRTRSFATLQENPSL